jgi:hypothetical protein
MSTQKPVMTDQQRVALRIHEEFAEERRKRWNAYVADWRAMNPEKRAASVAKQSAKRRADRARKSNRDLIGE